MSSYIMLENRVALPDNNENLNVYLPNEKLSVRISEDCYIQQMLI